MKDSGKRLGDILAEALAKRDAKFKVGDRVRLVKDGLSTTGAVGKLATIDSWGDEVIDKENGQYLLKIDPPHHDYSTLANDRAYTRATPDCFVAVALQQQPLTLTAGRCYKNRSGATVGPIEAEGGNFRAYVDGSVRLFATSGEHLFGNEWLDLVEEVPLKIEAGRYYRTRDGRKVLVEVNTLPDTTKWPWRHDGGNGGYHGVSAAGKSCIGSDSDDLIAEWTDEPIATGKGCAAAEVDNLRDEYGWAATKAEPKFKVGDRVKFRDDYSSSAAGKEATVINVDSWGIQVDQGGEWGISTEAAADLRLVAPATSGKFKVGDRVVYDGHTAILREILDGDRYIPYLIEFESDVGYGHNGNNVGKVRLTSNRGWWVENITAAVASPAIVARLDNGQPRPASNPHVHADRASAEKEAARLASANPGKEFAVYEFVSSAKEERRYEHEWQRAAKDGREYEAACLLQDMAGTSFGGAQKAVEHWLSVAA